MPRKIKISDEEIVNASNLYSSASAAASALGIKYDTYKRHAIRLNVFETNMSGKGINKKRIEGKIPLQEILEGKHPQYQSNKLRKRILSDGLKDHRCEECLNSEWLGKPISLELEHINGNHSDHSYNNLKLLCPNCHAQTSTYRGKNIKKASVVERYTQRA